jgi:NitT/TauT family transport system ATP-binding protein
MTATVPPAGFPADGRHDMGDRMEKIRLENVTFSYQQQGAASPVVEDVSLTIREGEFVSLIGPSGCGKSTVLRLLAGLSGPSRGRILLNGREIAGTGHERGVVFQHYALFPWMTARDNVIFGLRQCPGGMTRKNIEATADRYLDLVGLHDVDDKYPNQLSGGMQQRVTIARAFAMDTDILLMDEPFSAVDARNRMTLQELLLELWRKGQKKKTVVFVTHDVDEAILLSDRIVVLSACSRGIKEQIEVGLSRPRNWSLLANTATYTALRNRLIGLLFTDLMEETKLAI